MKAGKWLAAGALLLAAWGCKEGGSIVDGSSPLAEAVSRQEWSEAIALVESGADPNTKVHQISVLYWALSLDDRKLSDKLAEKGAELDITIDDHRLIDALEQSAAQNPSDERSRSAVAWLEAHGVKRRP